MTNNRFKNLSAAAGFKRRRDVRSSRTRSNQMSEFTYLYRGGRDTPQSPEQRQKQLQKWAAWFKELGASGQLKEIGHPLEGAGMVVKGNQKVVTDGPYAE